MARTPQAGVRRNRRISVRVTEDEEAALDVQRGKRSQADYIRDLVVQDGRRQRIARIRAGRTGGSE